MSENESIPESNSPWRRLRELEPPLGSERRVILSAQRELSAPSPAPRWARLIVLGAVLLSGVVLWVFLSGDSSSAESPLAIAPHSSDTDSVAGQAEPTKVDALSHSQQASNSVAESIAPDKSPRSVSSTPVLPSPTLSIPAGDSTAIQLANANLDVVGPANIVLVPEGVKIRFGQVKIAGDARIIGPQCEVFVHGKARSEVVGQTLSVSVLSGSATSSNPKCKVSYVKTLLLRKAPGAVTPTPSSQRSTVVTERDSIRPERESIRPEKGSLKHDEPQSTRELPDNTREEATVSPLRHQLESYKVAQALLATQPQAAIVRLKRFVKKWPQSPLQEEAQAAIVDGLLVLGKYEDAARRVEVFRRRFPTSSYTNRLVRGLERVP